MPPDVPNMVRTQRDPLLDSILALVNAVNALLDAVRQNTAAIEADRNARAAGR